MDNTLQLILDWSEVWALLIPLAVLLRYRKQPRRFRPVILYLFLALALNLFGDVIADFKRYLPQWLQSNNPLYNLHSVVRFACFSTFFISLGQSSFRTIKKILPLISLVFLLVNFSFFGEDFFLPEHLSGNLLTVEAYLLLVYCMLYYLSQLKEEVTDLTKTFDFWVVTGLGVYVVVNFYVFLFYIPLIGQKSTIAYKIWDIHNVAYILFCSFIAKAFYANTATA